MWSKGFRFKIYFDVVTGFVYIVCFDVIEEGFGVCLDVVEKLGARGEAPPRMTPLRP